MPTPIPTPWVIKATIALAPVQIFKEHKYKTVNQTGKKKEYWRMSLLFMVEGGV